MEDSNNENFFFDYDEASFEKVSCNLCGSRDFIVLAKKSTNDLNVQTCLCKNCGLVYISPRMSRANYDDYYKYFYRKDRADIKKEGRKNIDMEEYFEGARVYGRALSEYLSKKVGGPVIDVGSSTGGLLYGLKEKVPYLEVLGIEPSYSEAQFANNKGVKTIVSLFEDFDKHNIGSASNILCVRSLNHLLDPRKFLEWAFDTLAEGGHIILTVKNFRHQCRRAGRIESAVQIDHPYMFTPETLKLFVESVGFKIVDMDVDEEKGRRKLEIQREEGFPVSHIRVVGEKIKKSSAEEGFNVNGVASYKKQLRAFKKLNLMLYHHIFYSPRFSILRNLIGIRR